MSLTRLIIINTSHRHCHSHRHQNLLAKFECLLSIHKKRSTRCGCSFFIFSLFTYSFALSLLGRLSVASSLYHHLLSIRDVDTRTCGHSVQLAACQVVEEGGGNGGQLNAEKALDQPGTVHLGGFQHTLGYVAEGGQE